MLLALLTAAYVMLPRVELELRDVGDGQLQGVLHNRAGFPITLVLPGDGSDVGWRTPTLRWEITEEGADEPLPEIWAPRMCGNMNALEESDIVTLAPNEARAFPLWSTPPLPGPGRFRVALRYVNDPTFRFRDGEQPELLARVRRSHPLEVRSNEITVEAKEPGPGDAYWKRRPLLRGELSEPELSRIGGCYGFRFYDDEPCTDRARRYAARIWQQRCVSRVYVEELRARERAKLLDRLEELKWRNVGLVPHDVSLTPSDAGLRRRGDDILLTTPERAPVVALDERGVLHEVWSSSDVAPVAVCDTGPIPSLGLDEMRTWRVIANGELGEPAQLWEVTISDVHAVPPLAPQ